MSSVCTAVELNFSDISKQQSADEFLVFLFSTLVETFNGNFPIFGQQLLCAKNVLSPYTSYFHVFYFFLYFLSLSRRSYGELSIQFHYDS